MRIQHIAAYLLTALACASCAKQGTGDFANPTTAAAGAGASKFLYVSSGACFGGGVTLSTPTNTIVRFNLATGAFDSVVADYTLSTPD